jgi:hypothetical protein
MKAAEMAEKVARILRARAEGVPWSACRARFGSGACSAAMRQMRAAKGGRL